MYCNNSCTECVCMCDLLSSTALNSVEISPQCLNILHHPHLIITGGQKGCVKKAI